MRLDLEDEHGRWLVYAPADREVIELPEMESELGALGASKLSVVVQAVRADVEYAELWRFGSGASFADDVVAFTERRCVRDGACALE